MNTLLMLFIFVPILSLVLLALNFLLAPKNAYESKVSAYGCGFSPIYGQTRSTFQIHFYVVAMLDRKSTRLNSSHSGESRMPSSA